MWSFTLNTCITFSTIMGSITNYWSFSGSTVDIVGGMNLTIKLNGHYDVDRFGDGNSALYLNKGYATAPSGVYFDCAVGYTIMTWIKLIGTGYYPRILDFSNGYMHDSVLLCFTGGTSSFMSLTSKIDNTWNPFAPSNAPLTLGVWTHVAATVNSIATNLYINGKLTGTSNGGTCASVCRSLCKIGRSGNYPTQTDLNAVLDELKIFNRVLNQTEISNEMLIKLAVFYFLDNFK